MWTDFLTRMRKGWKTLLLYFYTLRYLRPVQLIYRSLFELKFRVYKKCPAVWERIYSNRDLALRRTSFLKGLQEKKKPWRFPDQTEILERSNQLLGNEFVFLNHAYRFQEDLDWRCPSASHLWRYHLHYFDYARDLGIAYLTSGDKKYYLKFKEFSESWMAQNPLGQLDGWHPYTISRRVVNWIYAYELFRPLWVEEDRVFPEKFLQSLCVQCDFLFHNLEYQGYGNHLLANVKTLIFGGLFFEGKTPDRWLRTGLRLLQQELDEQILSDGGHFERSPMYHLLVMKDLIECFVALNASGHKPWPGLRKKIDDMARFTEAMLTPEGRIPLLNDSAYDLSPDPRELIGMAKHLGQQTDPPPGLRAFSSLLLGAPAGVLTPSSKGESLHSVALKDTGYFVLRGADRSALILDCGPVCPDYLPPHAHADTLSYELWVNGIGIITDSGVYEYTSGIWRDFFRSTRAHNTVTVDGENQSEVWGSFRVARRAYPHDVIWIATEEGDYFCGGHDGYRRLKDPVLHRRRVLHLKGEFWMVLDQITGRGQHRADSFIHIHPEATVDLKTSGMLRASRDGSTLTVWAFDYDHLDFCSGQIHPPQGWYSPEFGIKRPRQTFCLTRAGSVPFCVGYVLTPRATTGFKIAYNLDETEWYEITLDETRWRIDVCPTKAEFCVQKCPDEK